MPEPIHRIMVLDAFNLIFRAFYAIPPLTAPDGTPTNAVVGVANMVLRLLDDLQPDAVAVAIDLPGKSFRHEVYADYKAQRKPTPEELIVQIPLVLDLLRAMGLPIVSAETFEADDVIGTLARMAVEAEVAALLVSGDRDLFQLVGGATVVITTDRSMREHIILDAEGVLERMGVRPDQVVDYKALVGDSSDNIPGLKGIGPKRAQILFESADHIADMLENPECIADEKLRARIVESADEIRKWQDLCRIRQDVPLDVRIDELVIGDRDVEALDGLVKRLGLTRLADRLLDTTKMERDIDFHTAATDRDAERAARSARAAGFCAIHLALRGDALAGLALATLGEPVWHFALGSDELALFAEESSTLPEPIIDVLQDATVRKDCYDLKETEAALRRAGISPAGLGFDSLLAAYLLGFGESNLSLPGLALRYLGRTIEAGQGPAELSAAAGAIAELRSPLQKELEEEGLTRLYTDIELPLATILRRMEEHGICVDIDTLKHLSKWLAEQMREAERACHEAAGGPFTINSPKQLQQILFDKLKLSTGRKTKTGYSTDADVLAGLAGQHPIIQPILDYRTYAKLKSTYADALVQQADAAGRVHTRLNQAATATGRLSSSDPNLQNIPTRTELGQEVRKCFVAPGEGMCLLACDYSQIELRVLAHFCKDEALCAAFLDGVDIHTRTASLVFDVPEPEVTRQMRGQAKAVNFGIIYGMGSTALARDLGISKSEAQGFMDRYFLTYSGVKTFIEGTIAQASELGFVTTLLGRKRLLPELTSGRPDIRRFGERIAVNTPIQGSAADMIKKAMIDVDAALRDEPDVCMILQVHDELLFELPESRVAEVAPRMCKLMADALELAVPIVVDAKSGRNWGEMAPLAPQRNSGA